jgi:hypothetical protein
MAWQEYAGATSSKSSHVAHDLVAASLNNRKIGVISFASVPEQPCSFAEGSNVSFCSPACGLGDDRESESSGKLADISV